MAVTSQMYRDALSCGDSSIAPPNGEHSTSTNEPSTKKNGCNFRNQIPYFTYLYLYGAVFWIDIPGIFLENLKEAYPILKRILGNRIVWVGVRKSVMAIISYAKGVREGRTASVLEHLQCFFREPSELYQASSGLLPKKSVERPIALRPHGYPLGAVLNGPLVLSKQEGAVPGHVITELHCRSF